MEERFFYHNFPRRGASTADENDKGCKILAAIRDFGLLLTPQLIEWNQPNVGGPPRAFPVLQKRVCFTELNPVELPQHAEKFGHFALEFEIDTVRRLGAVLVFYVPQPTSEAARDGSALGTALLAIAMDSHVVIARMAFLNRDKTSVAAPLSCGSDYFTRHFLPVISTALQFFTDDAAAGSLGETRSPEAALSPDCKS